MVRIGLTLLVLLGGGGLAGCSDESNPLAPYGGERPLILQQVTRSAAPELQWVGGRTAAVGVNRGPTAALDETLVWVVRAATDTLGSPVAVGPGLDAALIAELGGTPLDSLPSGEEYTFWLAEQEAFAALQAGAAPSPGTFADTTLTLDYVLRGRSGGDPNLGVTFEIIRNQTLVSDTYTVTWTPADVPFKRLAIRQGTTGGFTDLAWHVVVPDGDPAVIQPPVVLGQAPPGTVEAQEWTGFEPANYVFWMVTPDWDGQSFGFRTEGYAFFQIFSNNFE